jgi:hypothetical protein
MGGTSQKKKDEILAAKNNKKCVGCHEFDIITDDHLEGDHLLFDYSELTKYIVPKLYIKKQDGDGTKAYMADFKIC